MTQPLFNALAYSNSALLHLDDCLPMLRTFLRQWVYKHLCAIYCYLGLLCASPVDPPRLALEKPRQALMAQQCVYTVYPLHRLSPAHRAGGWSGKRGSRTTQNTKRDISFTKFIITWQWIDQYTLSKWTRNGKSRKWRTKWKIDRGTARIKLPLVW